ncbi:hypothetical protein KGQ25_01805 [Patescibacteria group bacterium]|nr:hypothetical protein [Patescibacteria group bacterium]
MVIADEHIAEFQMLYKEHFGVELTKAQALEKGLRLTRLIETVSRALAREQAETSTNIILQTYENA